MPVRGFFGQQYNYNLLKKIPYHGVLLRYLSVVWNKGISTVQKIPYVTERSGFLVPVRPVSGRAFAFQHYSAFKTARIG
jgi:hypothetical protein